MNLRCVGCQGPLSGGESACPQCGRPVDMDGNGLPDDLDRKVQAAARQAVAEERARDVRRDSRGTVDKELRMAEARLENNLKTPRTFGALAVQRFWTGFIATTLLLLIGLAFPVQLLFGAIGASPAGLIACEFQCDTCSGPGRQFTWNYRGSCQSNKGRMGSALVCHNREINIDSMQWMDVTRRNDELQPYIVHGAVVYFANSFALGLLVGVLRALFGTGKELRGLDDERQRLEAEARALRAQADQLKAMG